VAAGGQIFTISKTDGLVNIFDTKYKNLSKFKTDTLLQFADISTIIKKIIQADNLLSINELFLKSQLQSISDNIINLSDDYIASVTGVVRKLLRDSILLFDSLNKKEEKNITEILSILFEEIVKKENKINADILLQLVDISTKKISKLTSEELKLYDAYRKQLSKTEHDNIVNLSDIKYFSNIKTIEDILSTFTDTLIKVLERTRADDFLILDDYEADITAAIRIVIKLLQDSVLFNDIFNKNLTKVQSESLLGIYDNHTEEIIKIITALLYLLSGIKDYLGKESNIVDLIGKSTDIKGH